MARLAASTRLRAFARTALPGLRVVGMAYTGLIGIAAAVLVVSVAFVPAAAPALQIATQPVDEAVGSIVQPATSAVANIAAFRRVPPEPESGVPRSASGPLAVRGDAPHAVAPPEDAPRADALHAVAPPEDVAPKLVAEPEAAMEPQPAVEPQRAEVARVLLARPRPEPQVVVEDSEPVVDEVVAEQPEQVQPPVLVVERAPTPVVVAEPQVQQAADVEPPRPLPSTPRPTETTWQVKARLDADNQAAIDARKAAQARAKAESDAANQAAIDLLKGAAASLPPRTTATAVPEAAFSVPAEPAKAVVPEQRKGATTVAPALQTKAEADAENQALIDAARAARVRAKADANAANQAAIDAARSPKAPTPAPARPAAVEPVPVPTAEPAVMKPVPVPRAEPVAPNPASATVDRGAAASADRAAADDRAMNDAAGAVDGQQGEAPVMLALDPPEG